MIELKSQVGNLENKFDQLSRDVKLNHTNSQINKSDQSPVTVSVARTSPVSVNPSLPNSAPSIPPANQPIRRDTGRASQNRDGGRAAQSGEGGLAAQNEERGRSILWSEVAKEPGYGETDQDGFTIVTTAKKTRVIAGMKSSAEGCKVKGVAKRGAVFVGRLNKETTVEDLTAYLETSGISGAYCRKLSDVTKEGYQYKTSAFFVSCDASCTELLFSENTWPENSIIREWGYFKK